MADPLSISASIVALLQLTSTVVQYINNVKDASKERLRIRDEISCTSFLLYMLEGRVQQAHLGEPWLSMRQSLDMPKGPLEQFRGALEQLASRLEPSKGLKRVGKSLAWPFKTEEIKEILSTIERQKSLFNLVLQNDHIALSKAINDDIARINDGIEELQIEQKTFLTGNRGQKIHQWLSPPDPSSSHKAACKRRQPTTGAWFVEGRQFEEWKISPNSFLWLHGIPGCGKTILCSTIIQDVIDHYKADTSVAVVYFYFDFNDAEKQHPESLIRSLIKQLSIQSKDTPEALNKLFARSQDGQQQPTTEGLTSTLQLILRDFHQSFIILDALDESREREELLELTENIVKWKLETLHLLATSRREKDIEENLTPLITGQICIQSTLVDADIRIHIRERLQNDAKLRKWPEDVRMEIEKTLMGGAKGMFQWVVCQLDALGKCLKPDALRRALKSLPKTLGNTYARILCDIDEEYSQDAFKILQWLAYSARPLRIEEVAEVIAVNIGKENRFNPDNRLREPRDILTICSSLVTTVVSTIQSDFGNTTEVEELRLAHFSVKEYLVSDRIHSGPASRYSIKKTCAEATISQTCLTYLLHFKEPSSLVAHHLSDFPLARYAAQYWSQHALAALHDTERTNTLIAELFGPNKCPYTNWIRIYDPDQPWGTPNPTKSFKDIACPLYYASLLGMIEIVQHLLENGAEVNCQGGRYGNALQAASLQGHDVIVQQLLDKGADVKAQGGEYGNALNAASSQGRETVVRILLENGAEAGTGDKEGRTPLSWATKGGHETVVQILLNRADANVAAVDNLSKNALHHAIDNYPHSTNIVQLLLAAGIPATDSDMDNMTPLHYAVVHNSPEIANLLMNHGIDVDIRVRRESYHTVRKGRGRLLLGSAIEHKLQDICGLTPLHAAAFFGCCTMVSYLLDMGANINASDELSQTPLHLAVKHMCFGTKATDAWNNDRFMAEAALDHCEDFEGPEYADIATALCDLRRDLIKRLLDGGSDLHAQDCNGQTPLHAVRYGQYGQSDIVKLMLQAGADPTIKDSRRRTALHIAARSSDPESVLLLVEALINITVADNEGLNVLHHAAYAGDYQTLEIILRHRDSPILTKAKDKAGLNAIHQNLQGWQTSSKAIEKLVDGGVNPRDVDYSGMTSLHHVLASSKLWPCPLEILGTLLTYNINAAEVDLNGMNCLHFAVRSMVHVPIATLQLLIEKGADVTAADSSGMTVLHHASSAGCINAETLSFLVMNGVGLNAVDNNGQTPLHHARKRRMSAEKSDHYSHIFGAHRWAESEDILVKYGAVD